MEKRNSQESVPLGQIIGGDAAEKLRDFRNLLARQEIAQAPGLSLGQLDTLEDIRIKDRTDGKGMPVVSGGSLRVAANVRTSEEA